MKKILCSWVGNSDWLPSEGLGRPGEPGPIARTMEDPVFGQVDELRCLNNYQHRKGSDFKKWIATKTSAKVYCEDVLLKSPTDFRGVYEATDELIKTIRKENSEEQELIFLCSGGTWTMQYCLLQLALTKYPARLIEASKEAGVVKMDIPFEINVDYLIDHVDRARREVSSGLRVDEPELNDIVHDCRPMRLAIKRVRRIAPRNISILIQGPSGTGKKLIGRLLHKLSQRSMRPLEIFNCGAIPEDLLEVELFGSEIYDPLDDATKTTKGRLEQANNSTLFLDEVSELPLQIQVKLLRAIEDDGKFTRVGGTKTIKADIRFISATNHQLNEEVAAGRFRADLFYRLAEDVVSLPPLQNRDDDISLITKYLLPELCKKLGYEEKTVNAGALNLLKKYPFPGNVRELSNILVRAIVHSDRNQISKADIEDALSISPVPDDPTTVLEKPLGQNFSLNDLLDQVTRHYINRAGEASNKNVGKASKLLGFNNYQTLSKRMGKLGIKW